MMVLGRWSRASSATLVAAACVLVCGVACTDSQRPGVQAQPVALPTPLSSLGARMSGAVASLRAATEGVGSRLEKADRPFRPSEPEALLEVPRAVFRADLADPDDGFVVVYQAADAAAAHDLAQVLADYLGSGFGQTNYARDTQFSVAVVHDSVVFTTWSRGRSSDPERAEAIFDAIAALGAPAEVLE